MECPICGSTKIRRAIVNGRDSVRCQDCGSSPDDENESSKSEK
jgi:transposase-like protein